MSEETKMFINEVGRTEDIRFSKDITRAAIAGFLQHCCILLHIQVQIIDENPKIIIVGSTKITSKNLTHPHGVEFIGNEYLIVCNRTGCIDVFDIRNIQFNDKVIDLKPIRTIKRANFFEKINSPGSLAVLHSSDKKIEILVCNNYSHQITHHDIPLKSRFKLTKSSIFLKNGLNIPDGISINKNKTWVAISNHGTNSVLLFDLKSKLSISSEHTGELINIGYPHGIRFSEDGNKIFVADAGSPYIFVYETIDDSWNGKFEPVTKYKVLSDEDYLRGRTNPEEGGPKGLDIIEKASLIAITNQETPFQIFNLNP